MATAPPSYSALPTPPDTNDPLNFDTRADAFLAALPAFQTETNALAANAYANASDANTQASAAAASAATAVTNAATAASNAGATIWVSGTTYSVGDARYSPINLRVYRRKVGGAGTTDPSLDPTNWMPAIPDPTGSNVFLALNFGGL